MFKVYIMNLGKYNEGSLVGEWLELPASEEEIKETLDNISINDLYEEYIIADYENNFNFKISEYSNIEELSQVAEYLESLDEYEQQQVNALLDGGYIDYKNLVNEDIELDNYIFVELDQNTILSDESNLAYSLIDTFYNGDLSQIQDIENYFDYEKFANDLYFNFDVIVDGMDKEDIEDLEKLSKEEFANWYIEGLDSIEELGQQTLENYFDYESYGRDLIFNGAYIANNGIAIL